MTTGVRRILYSLATLVFIVLAPLLIMYSEGYRLDVRSFRMYRTLSLAVESTPSGATVFIDGKPRGKTPLTITALYPGGYAIRIERAGFLPWERHIDVSSRSQTLAPHLSLATPNETFFELDHPSSMAALSESETAVVSRHGSTGTQLSILDLKQGKELRSVALPDMAPESVGVQWSPSGTYLLYQTLSGGGLLDTKTLTPVAHPDFHPGDQILWAPGHDDQLLILRNETLWSTSLNSAIQAALVGSHVKDIIGYNDTMYVLREGPDASSVLLSFDRSLTETSERSLTYPATTLLALSSRYAIVSNLGQEAEVIDLGSGTSVRTSMSGILIASISPDGTSALLSSATDAWSADLVTGEATLLGRFSSLVGGVTLPDNGTALLMIANRLVIIDTSDPAAQAGSYELNDGSAKIQSLTNSKVAILGADGLRVIDFKY